jgi:hypothetical protein
MFQPSFAAEDVPYRSLPTMSKDILQAMMPGVHFYEADTTEGGRLVARPECANKTYLHYERQESEQRPNKRAFGRANSAEHKQYSSIRPSKKSFIPMFRSSLQRKLEREQRKLEREKLAGASSD